jgi:S1-C subfamily serine protease
MADLKAAQDFLDQYAGAVSAIVETVSVSIVRVQRHDDGGRRHNRWQMGRARTNWGSGVIIDAEQGYVLTSYHVVSGTQDVELQLFNGKKIAAKRIGKDPENDLALIKVNPAGLGLTALKFGDSAALKPGSVVIALGNPDGERVVATSGIVSALNQSLRGPNGNMMDGLIQTDAMFNPGMSGGPLVNSSGQIIGLNTASMREAQGINLAVASATIQKVVPDLAEHGIVQRPRLGIAGERRELYEGLAEHLKLDQTHGVYLHQVMDKSAAAQAGVQTGDIIVVVDDQTVTGMDSLARALLGKKFGDTLAVKVIRKLDLLEIAVKLIEDSEDQKDKH